MIELADWKKNIEEDEKVTKENFINFIDTVQNLVNEIQSSKLEIKNLTLQLNSVTNKNSELQNEIKKLNKQIEILKFAPLVKDLHNKSEIKKEISDFIDKIDKLIQQIDDKK